MFTSPLSVAFHYPGPPQAPNLEPCLEFCGLKECYQFQLCAGCGQGCPFVVANPLIKVFLYLPFVCTGKAFRLLPLARAVGKREEGGKEREGQGGGERERERVRQRERWFS